MYYNQKIVHILILYIFIYFNLELMIILINNLYNLLFILKIFIYYIIWHYLYLNLNNYNLVIIFYLLNNSFLIFNIEMLFHILYLFDYFVKIVIHYLNLIFILKMDDNEGHILYGYFV